MAASGAPVRQPRRGPAPIASFDHDVSDEVNPVCIIPYLHTFLAFFQSLIEFSLSSVTFKANGSMGDRK